MDVCDQYERELNKGRVLHGTHREGKDMTICCSLACGMFFMFAFFNCCAYSDLLFLGIYDF